MKTSTTKKEIPTSENITTKVSKKTSENIKTKVSKLTSEGIEYTQTDITDTESYQNPNITYLDELEDSCWSLFRDYCTLVGIEFPEGNDEPDFNIIHKIEEAIIAEVEEISNCPFPVSADG